MVLIKGRSVVLILCLLVKPYLVAVLMLWCRLVCLVITTKYVFLTGLDSGQALTVYY